MDIRHEGEDAVDLCIRLLSKAYPRVIVTNEMPQNHPKRPYVMVSRTGGTSSPYLDEPIMTLTCWDVTDDGARSLATGCAQVLSEAALDDPFLSAATLNSLSRDLYAPNGYGGYQAQIKLTINI